MDSNIAEAKERMNNYVAVTVAVLAAFMAITKVKDDNICQVMVKEKSEEVNTWSRYQSKSIKQNLAELGHEQLVAMVANAPQESRADLQARISRYATEISRYEGEKAEIKNLAERHAQSYDQLNYRDDQFDLSDATLSLGLAMLAVTALTGKRWLLYLSWGVGAFGALFGIAGLAGLKIHPEWIVRALS